MSTPQTENQTADRAQPTDLSRFQIDILRVIEREGAVYGLGIKHELEQRYGGEVNHGRLYPNLDNLVDAGLVAKSEQDGRTNDYELTIRGQLVLKKRREWLANDDAAETTRATIANGGRR